MPTDTIPARIFEHARTHPMAVAYRTRQADGSWQATSWADYAYQIRTATRALVALGFEPGDTIAILGGNRPEWVVADVAAMTAGGVPAGIYTTCSPSEVAYIIRHAASHLVVVENPDQWAKVDAEKSELPDLAHIVVLDGADTLDDPMVLSWDAFLAKGDDAPDSVVDKRVAALDPDTVGTFIYTSGTTGPPKAVMLTHGNLAHTASVACDMVDAGAHERMVSYLPLSHIAEQMFTIHGPATAGYEIWYAESLDALLRDMQDARPTILFGVPRVWEKMHAGLSARLGEATGVKAALASWARDVGTRVAALRNRGEVPGGLLGLQYGLADKLIFSKIKGALGMDAAKFGISGAAPIASEVLQFFASLDIVIHEVYGQSEGSGPTTFNTPGHTRFGTVGTAIPGTDVRIADDGEIVLKGPNVFAGYYKDEAATADALIDGWLHSGDLGSLDGDGFLTITGRKKEIIITAGGKNIAPKNIEAAIKNLPLVSQAVVIGDRRKFLSALITLDPEAAAAFADEHGLDADALHADDRVHAALQKGIDDEVNPLFARVEHVRKFAILPRDLTVDDGELTPTLKVKRRVVDDHFADVIENMYAETSS